MTKRPYGQGSIYKDDASGLWCATVTADGKRRTVRSKRKDVVVQKLAALQRDVAAGLPIATSGVTVGAFLAEWLAAKRSSLAPQTSDSYERRIRRQVVPHIGSTRLSDLDRTHIQGLYELLQDEGLSAQTVNHVDAILKTALKEGVRWGRVARNVAELVDPPRVVRVQPRVLSAVEASRFLDCAQGDRYEAIYVLAIGTGMRRGELLGLHWRDVDLDRGLLSVNWNLIRTSRDELQLDAPKTAQSRRRLTLDEETITALREHRARQLEQRLQVGTAWQETDLVFCNEVGRATNPSNLIVRSFWPIRKQAGFDAVTTTDRRGRTTVIVPALRFHDLRHTAGTLMLEANVPLKIVSSRLGHSNINVTADTYLHVTDRMDHEAAVAVGDLLRRSRR